MLSKTSPVVVVGGGVFGLGTALSLTARGYTDVTVFDRLPIPAEDAASTDINKMVRADYGADTLYQDLCLAALPIWRSWNKQSIAAGQPPLYHETGVLFASGAMADGSFERVSHDHIKAAVGAEVAEASLTPAAKIDPKTFPALSSLRRELPKGYFNSQAGWADASRTVSFMADMARRQGVRIVTGQAGTLSALLSDAPTGDVIGIRTADGQAHQGSVILATGAWSASILPELRGLILATGQPVVQFKIPDDMRAMYSGAPIDHLNHSPETADELRRSQGCPVWAADITRTGYYGFPMTADGYVKIANHGPGYTHPQILMNQSVSVPKTSVSDPVRGTRIPRESVLAFREFVQVHLPHLNTLDIARTRMCCPVPGRRGLIVATGGSGHAFKFAPVLGDVVADVYEGKRTPATRRFAWRVPRGHGAVKESSRKSLQAAHIATPEDLTALAFTSGRLKASMTSARL
ncbi:FAD dependent oxidoreductase [Entophlyctis helioformis]|nr:FAD dependent oxidoreductase [Entophlyctis helioformis]